VTKDCRCECEVRRRIALAKEAFKKKKDLMCGSLSLQLKKRIVKAFVWSIALYGSETWTLQKSDIKRIEGFEIEIWIWRRMLKVSWSEHKKNDEVLRTVETRRELMDALRTRQKRWLGRVTSWYFGENSVGRSTTREERKMKTERNATELATGQKK